MTSLVAPFHHQAFFYAGDDEYLAGPAAFVEEGIEAGETVLVAVPPDRRDLLLDHFGASANGLLHFASIEEMGGNPARIIPAWSDFVRDHGRSERGARGVGEPIWSGRSAEELVECERHEALLNLALADATGFKLLCPYDVRSLDRDVIARAHRNHPHLDGIRASTAAWTFEPLVPPLLDTALAPVPASARTMVFDAGTIREVRTLAGEAASVAGFDANRVDDLEIAVSEAVTNTVLHGGGRGEIAFWYLDPSFVCEIRDRGRITDPLAGRRRPDLDASGGRGLWLINQLCDLVQLRILPDGQQVLRLHLSR
ncbi:MAG TPA: sensor histidine kinase [Acidimicrobiales bacterium]|jgi:anti-sigma regulatory factor (Ser/Thr protein kinase)